MADRRRRQLVDERLDAIRRIAAQGGSPAALLQGRANFAWATAGGENHVVLSSATGVAGLLVLADRAVILTPINEAARIADEEVAGLDIEVVPLPWHDDGTMTLEAERLAGGTPAGDDTLEDLLCPMRCALAELEVERMTWLAERAVAAARAGLSAARPGRTEHHVVSMTLALLADEGVRAPVLLAAADDRIARYRHPIPTDRAIERRLMLVVVAERWGLHVALTRFAELAAPDADLRRRIDAARQVHDAMVAATRPGRTLGDVLDAARAAYASTGHPDEWELHHQGGIIGYQGRERIATPGDPTPIATGMAYAWNPSIAGAKAEETILLVDGRPLTLTA